MSYRATHGMSGFGAPYTKQYNQTFHKVPFSAETMEIFKLGTEIHEFYQALLKEKYFYKSHPLFDPFKNFIVIAHEHPVYKVIEGKLYTSNIDTLILDEEEKVFHIIDYKSASKIPTKPKPENVIQLSVYNDTFDAPEGYTKRLWLCYIDKADETWETNKWFEVTPGEVETTYYKQKKLIRGVKPTALDNDRCQEGFCPCEYSTQCNLNKEGIIDRITDGESLKGKFRRFWMDNGDRFGSRLEKIFDLVVGDKITYAHSPNPKSINWLSNGDLINKITNKIRFVAEEVELF